MSNVVMPIGVPDLGYAGRSQLLRFNHRVVTSTSGAIASQDAAADSGVVAVKTAAKVGRYTLTIANGRKTRQFRGGTITLIGPADATWGAVSLGLDGFWRQDDFAVDGTIEVQFARGDTVADAELPNGAIFILDFLTKV